MVGGGAAPAVVAKLVSNICMSDAKCVIVCVVAVCCARISSMTLAMVGGDSGSGLGT